MQIDRQLNTENFPTFSQQDRKLVKISAKQEACKKVEKTIKDIKLQYKTTEQQIKATGIPHVIVDATSLIKAECERNKVKEDTVRRVAGWENLRTGNSRINTKIDETD